MRNLIDAVMESMQADLKTMRADHGARHLYEQTIEIARQLRERHGESVETGPMPSWSSDVQLVTGPSPESL